MEGTLIIPEKVINFSEVFNLRIHKGGRVYIDFDGGSVDCDFTAFWNSLTPTYKGGIKALIEKVVELSDEDITISGEF